MALPTLAQGSNSMSFAYDPCLFELVIGRSLSDSFLVVLRVMPKKKTAKHVQDIKNAIDADRSADNDWRLRFDEMAANTTDTFEWQMRFAIATEDYILQLERLLDQHGPDWRKRVACVDIGPPPGHNEEREAEAKAEIERRKGKR
jgi:hypothetical protein